MISYIMYLLDMPNRPEKKPGYTRQQKVILDALKARGADLDSVKAENLEALALFKTELNKLREQNSV